MNLKDPQIFLVGETKVNEEEIERYLEYIGVPDWETDAPSDGEFLTEFYGRLCYRSFAVELNPNLTKIREGNAPYIDNIKGQAHGSVFEHSVYNFVFTGVSRIFTHELVRHRVGVAISQESLRFVRLDNLDFWLPSVVLEDPAITTYYKKEILHMEEVQRTLAKMFKIDIPNVDFHRKKTVTSAMRRLAPEGLGTTIGWSANYRTIRWVIENRTAPGAEEEIRVVFGLVAQLMIERYPNVFGDFKPEMVDGHLHYIPTHSKI